MKAAARVLQRFVLCALACGLVPCGLGACAGKLEDPSIFESPEVCNLDVHQDILIPRCAIEGCHAPASSQGGLELLTGNLGGRLVGEEAITCLDQLRIDPDDIEASHILIRLSPDPRCGDESIDRMPFIGQPLTEAEMTCVRAWVTELAEARR